jgi:hypothetical protein
MMRAIRRSAREPGRRLDCRAMPPAPIRALLAITGATAGVVIVVLLVLRPEKEVSTAIIAAAATVLGGSLAVAVGRYYEKASELEQVTRPHKIEIYEKFVAFWFRVLYASKLGQKQPTPTETMKWMVDFTQDVTMWGSDAVIFEWGAVRRKMANYDPTDPNRVLPTLLDFEKLLNAMRRDVGYPDTAVGPGDLLRLFVDDALADMLPKSQSQ